MSELKTIEKLVQEYKPRIGAIFGMEMGNVEVFSFSQFIPDIKKTLEEKGVRLLFSEEEEIKKSIKNDYMRVIRGRKNIYVNGRILFRLFAPTTFKKRAVVHELGHIVEGILPQNIIRDEDVRRILSEGFAEYAALEFPEIYKDDKNTKRAIEKERTSYKRGKRQNDSWLPLMQGYLFFKIVGDKIGRKNVPKVFQNPPQIMEEILEPEKYLKRTGEK